MNISAKTKIFSKIFKGVNLGSRYYGFIKKTRLRKSHAIVPEEKHRSEQNVSSMFTLIDIPQFSVVSTCTVPEPLTSVEDRVVV